MYKFKNYFKRILCISFMMIFCCSCNKSYSEINTELTGVLSKQYGIFLSSTAELVKAEYKDFAERNPYLTVIFDISDEDLHDAFNEEMWNQENIESAINGDIGVNTSVHWVYENENFKTHYYSAELYIEKISDNLYRVFFCGYGVNTKYFDS